MKPLGNGLLTGLFLQLAIGPVFFYILGIAIDSNFLISLFGVLAVTMVDYLYIGLSILGIGKLLETQKIRRTLGILSSLVLLAFGALALNSALVLENKVILGSDWSLASAFMGSFALTLSSPLTIVFWSGIFAAKALEKGYTNQELWIFGSGAGLATLLFLGTVTYGISLTKSMIPPEAITVLNVIVGILMICYGILALVKTIRFQTPSSRSP